jgi:periplasmic divalent cation tolerance protein
MKLLFTTAPAQEADKIANALLEERLVACANFVKGVHSRYWWKGALEDSEETLILMKTTDELADLAVARIAALHSYDVPEAVVVDIESGWHAYMHWIGEVTRTP